MAKKKCRKNNGQFKKCPVSGCPKKRKKSKCPKKKKKSCRSRKGVAWAVGRRYCTGYEKGVNGKRLKRGKCISYGTRGGAVGNSYFRQTGKVGPPLPLGFGAGVAAKDVLDMKQYQATNPYLASFYV